MPKKKIVTPERPSKKPISKEMQQLQADQRQARLPTVIAMYLKGDRCDKIAGSLAIDVNDVYHDLEYMRKLWREQNHDASAEALSEQLARIDLVEHEAWKCFEESRKNAEQRGIERDADNKVVKKTRMRKGQVGDPSFLNVILQCVDRRTKLLKLEDNHGTLSEELAQVVEIVVTTREQAADVLRYEQFVRGKIEADGIRTIDAEVVTEVTAT